MSNKLFVGNISWGASEEGLQNHFSQCGEVVSARIIMDRNSDTPKSKGFGFVEMVDEATAQKALSDLNEVDFEGRDLVVKIAHPKTPRGDIKHQHAFNR